MSMIQLMKKYWYPAWRYSEISQQSIKVILSLPTSCPLEDLQKQMLKKLRSRKIEVLDKREGFVSVGKISAISALNEGSLSWNDG